MKKTLYISIFVTLLASCKKETFDIQNLNGNRIYALGHGGMGFSNLYPINSFESILACLNAEADGTEIDVQMTLDSVLVAFHDETLDGSTDLSGIVNSLTWEQLSSGSYTNAPYDNYNIIRLEEVFSSLENCPGRYFTLDLKLYSSGTDMNAYYEAFSNELLDFYAKYDLYGSTFIESQVPEFLDILKAKNSNFQLYYYPQTFEDGFNVALDHGFKGISISTDITSKEQVEMAHSNGLFVTLWGANTKDKNSETIRKNPDMIQSDKIDHLVELLK